MAAMNLLGLGVLLMVATSTAFTFTPIVISPRSSGWVNAQHTRAQRIQVERSPLRAYLEPSRKFTTSRAQTGRPLSLSSNNGAAMFDSRSFRTRMSEGERSYESTSGHDQSKLGSLPANVFVAGGSGFVGSEICSQLVEAGCNVVALSRNGAPASERPWVKSVKWIEGNALNQDMYRAELRKSDTVVSCIGGVGKTDSYMELVNGDANIKLAEAAADAGVMQFVFLSVHDYKAPQFVRRFGYFEGKRRTEKVVGELFGSKGAILKPAFIYGERTIKFKGLHGKEMTFKLPLQHIGAALSKIAATGIAKKIAASGFPLADVAWTQPLSAQTVAKSAVRCCLDGVANLERGTTGKDSGDALVLRVQDMAEAVSSQK